MVAIHPIILYQWAIQVKKPMTRAAFNFIFCLFIIAATPSVHAQPAEYIKHPDKETDQIEFFSLFPEGQGPFPILFLLHGSQPAGAKDLVDFNYLQILSRQKIIAVAISMPGFGNSSGKRDFCGKHSQRAILAIVEHFKNNPLVDPGKMGIYGISKGAILAALVSAQSPDLSLQILEAGEYDLFSRLTKLPSYLSALKTNMLQEAGEDPQALIDRSALYHVDTMHQATLFLHGEFDDRRGLPSAIALHEKLIARGLKSRLKVFPGALHTLEHEKWETIIPFLREQFFELYGIGVNVKQIDGTTQISKIFPGTSSDGSGLRVGDVVLALSPYDDGQFLNALNMPSLEFITYLLGKKDSSICLRVEHFDYSIEEIHLKRGSR